MVSEFATRFCGSSDLYEWSSRRPHASINFVTCHDGFTLHDLVSYDHKHNEANGEDNRDGTNDNISWNCGVEGPTDDPKINALRERKKREHFWPRCCFRRACPMLLAGDEIGHTQKGNNNAYCQDNEITWLNWDLTPEQESLLKFMRRVIGLSITTSQSFIAAGFFTARRFRGRRRRRSPGSIRPGRKWRRSLEERLCAVPGRAAIRRAKSTSTNMAKTSSATRCCCCSTPITSIRFHSFFPHRAKARARLGSLCSIRPKRTAAKRL